MDKTKHWCSQQSIEHQQEAPVNDTQTQPENNPLDGPEDTTVANQQENTTQAYQPQREVNVPSVWENPQTSEGNTAIPLTREDISELIQQVVLGLNCRWAAHYQVQ